MQFLKFMTGGAGRAARIVLGLVIMSLGQFVLRGILGTILTVVAFIPVAGGVFDFCLVGFAMGYPPKGTDARQKLAGK